VATVKSPAMAARKSLSWRDLTTRAHGPGRSRSPSIVADANALWNIAGRPMLLAAMGRAPMPARLEPFSGSA